MKRFAWFVVLSALLLSGCSLGAVTPNDEQAVSYQVGDEVEFGTYEQDNIVNNGSEPISWTVLCVEGNEALLLTNNIIDCYAYNSQEKNMNWEKCTLRAWLNSTFFSNAFSPEEQSRIIAHSIINESIQQKYIKKDGSIGNTAEPLPGCIVNDKVFLLSVDELHQYFSSNESRIANPTPYVILNADEAYKWWTRTPGSMVDNPKFVDEKGSTDIGGGLCTLSMGIRPAIWVAYANGATATVEMKNRENSTPIINSVSSDSQQQISGNSSARFTNAYGTPTTVCAHPGCNNYIASSGDTNCCTIHSSRCLNCGKYIDEDATFCLDCISKSINSPSNKNSNKNESSSSSSNSSGKTAKCNYCNGTGYADGGKCPWCGGSGKTYDNAFNDLLG